MINFFDENQHVLVAVKTSLLLKTSRSVLNFLIMLLTDLW